MPHKSDDSTPPVVAADQLASRDAPTLAECLDYQMMLMDFLFGGPLTEEELQRFKERGPTLLKIEPMPPTGERHRSPAKDQKS